MVTAARGLVVDTVARGPAVVMGVRDTVGVVLGIVHEGQVVGWAVSVQVRTEIYSIHQLPMAGFESATSVT